MPDIEDIIALLAKLYALWIAADFIVFGISLIIVLATGSLADLIVSLLISAALGTIPFPFNILAIWSVDPLSVVAQIVVFFVLVVIFRDSLSG
jgi:hypothetical protein